MRPTVLCTIVCILLTILACGQQKTSGSDTKQGVDYSITGNVSGAEGRTLYLQELPIARPGQQPQTIIIDSAVIGKGGNFSLTGNVSEPTIGLLFLDNQHSAYIFVEEGNTTFLADYNNWQAAGLEGSAGSVVMRNFLGSLGQQVNVIRTLQQQSQLLRQQRAPAEQQQALQAQEYGAMDQYYTFLYSFIDSTSYPALALYATDILDINMDYERVKAIRTKYEESMAGSQYLAQIDQKLATAGKMLGQPAPDISLPKPDGDTLALSDLRGQYVLLDFWAAWCGPCRRENPNVVKLYNEYSEEGFTVFSVSLDRNRADWLAAIEADGLVWPNHVSELAFWNTEAIRPYGVNSIPATFLVNPEGVIIAQNLRGFSLEKKLGELLGAE